MGQRELFDVTIIGGGPAGLYSAFYSGLREMKTKIIEHQPQLGGKIHVYPEKMIWDVGGLSPAPGAKLIEQLVEQGLTFHPEVVLNETVSSISQDENGIFMVEAVSGNIHYSKTVIVCVGGGILQPKKLNVVGAERYEVSNLNYTIKALEHFKDKTVVISGGGNSAIDWALELESIAKHVYITCRNDSFSCHEAQGTELQQGSVVCFFNSKITKLIASDDHKKIEKVELTNHETGVTSYLPIDEVIVNHGYERDTSLLDQSDLSIERIDEYFIAGTPASESSVPGLFAAGDILMHDGKLNLIAGAFQDAANAVNKAKQFIEPEATKTGMVSSHNTLFQKRNREILQEKVAKMK